MTGKRFAKVVHFTFKCYFIVFVLILPVVFSLIIILLGSFISSCIHLFYHIHLGSKRNHILQMYFFGVTWRFQIIVNSREPFGDFLSSPKREPRTFEWPSFPPGRFFPFSGNIVVKIRVTKILKLLGLHGSFSHNFSFRKSRYFCPRSPWLSSNDWENQ